MPTNSSIHINPLSVAKGQAHTCELCSLPATLLCPACRVTYYCSSGHQSTDAKGIHNKICSLLGALRSLRPTLGSEEERQRRQLTISMSQHAIIDLCKNEAKKHVVKQRYTLAIPGALQALRFSIQLYGKGKLELVSSYLLLAESNIGLGHLKTAEEFLLYANWAVLHSNNQDTMTYTNNHKKKNNSMASADINNSTIKTPSSSVSLINLKSQLHTMFGSLYFNSSHYDKAIDSYANAIYLLSCEVGPEHIELTIIYYKLSLVFESKNEIENQLAIIDKCIDILSKFLLNIKYRIHESINDYLSEIQIMEFLNLLLQLLVIRIKYLGHNHLAVGEAAYILALLKDILGIASDAGYLYELALGTYTSNLGESHESTLNIKKLLNELKSTNKTQATPIMTPITEYQFVGFTPIYKQMKNSTKSASSRGSSRGSSRTKKNHNDEIDIEEIDGKKKEEEKKGNAQTEEKDQFEHSRIVDSMNSISNKDDEVSINHTEANEFEVVEEDNDDSTITSINNIVTEMSKQNIDSDISGNKESKIESLSVAVSQVEVEEKKN